MKHFCVKIEREITRECSREKENEGNTEIENLNKIDSINICV